MKCTTKKLSYIEKLKVDEEGKYGYEMNHRITSVFQSIL